MNVLVQKKQVKPIKLKGVKPKAMEQDDWDEMDKLAKSTIMLSLDKSTHYNVNENQTSYPLWEELCGLFEQKSAASQVYWLKKLVDLKMKEGTSVSSHLNEFISIYGNLVAQEVEFKESMKVLFPLITLPDNWDTFRMTISNSAPVGGLTTERNVTGSLLIGEINRMNNEGSRAGNALTVRGRSSDKERRTVKVEVKDTPQCERHRVLSLWEERSYEEELQIVHQEGE